MILLYTVYKHTSPSNKVYIGITSQDVLKRWGHGWGYINNSYFWRAIQKYGWDQFKHEILYENLTKDEACALEKDLIIKYKSTNKSYGYNLSSGGDCSGSGVRCSEKKKLRIRESRLGDKHWFYGTHLSEEHRKKISSSLKGKKKSNTTAYKESATRLRGKPIRCVETNIEYKSVADAFDKTGICRSGISQVLIGKRKTAGGYRWEYVSKLNEN